jgi:RNA methyltransferase, TrmH family
MTPHPKTLNDPELKVAGRNACRALFLKRSHDVRRVYVTEQTLPGMKDVLRFCAEQKLAYHVVGHEDLTTISETVHHDGVCFIARERPQPDFSKVLQELQSSQNRSTIVLLEDVKNPHNLGAILRVCAHFGVTTVIAAGGTPALSPAAMRTAEGGAEHTSVVPVKHPAKVLRALRDVGFRIVATSSHASMTLGTSRFAGRSVLLFGSEGAGLSEELVQLADSTVAIPGSGWLESLNVACAASVLLWEATR